MFIMVFSNDLFNKWPLGLAVICGLFFSIASCNSESTLANAIPENKESMTITDASFFNEGQLCQHLREIFQDSQGRLWFGTNVYDLMQYDGRSFHRIREAQGFSGGRITGIEEDREGNIWFATADGLNKFDGKSFVQFTEADGLQNKEIWAMTIDTKGIIWIGHNEGLSRFDGKEFENIAIPKPTLIKTQTVYDPNRITAIVEADDGQLWLGTDGYGICKFNGIDFEFFTTKDGLPDNAIFDLMMDSKGLLWIGTAWGGASSFDGKKFSNYNKKDGINGIEVCAFFEDDNGDIWFGVENDGVYRYDGQTFTNFYKESNLNGSILSIYRDSEKRFWFGGWGGLYRMDGSIFNHVSVEGPWEP